VVDAHQRGDRLGETFKEPRAIALRVQFLRGLGGGATSHGSVARSPM
jgi:hypothetical protein